MTLGQLSPVMIAVAMLFAPVGMASGSAIKPTADHHAQAMDSGHCEEQPAPSNDSQSEEEPCCAAMCTAIAVAPAVPAEPLGPAASPDRPSRSGPGHSFLADLPTPPPRLA